jgi:arylsulfatase A-like enzyme
MSRWVSLLALAVVGCAGSDPVIDLTPADGPPTGGALSFLGERPRNVVVISMDTTRRDKLALYGGDPALMPFLNSMAEQGVTLDRHVSCSNWTMPSVSCIQTGKDNLDMGFVPRLQSDARGPLPRDTETIATWLGDAGYYTVLASGNSWFSSEWNTDAGFEWSFPASTGNATKLLWHGLWPLLLARVTGRAPQFYLHLHLVEPHASYNPPDDYLDGLDDLPPIDVDLTVKDDHYDVKADWPDMTPEEQALLEAHLRVRYDGELAYMDDQIEAIWTHLGELGLLRDTLVVFWTDHGEEFWEHGNQTHAYTLNTEENDALAIFWASNIEPARWQEPTGHVDVAPTILAALDLPIPEGLTGYPVGEAPPDRPLFGLAAGKIGVYQSVIQGGRKLMYGWNGSQKAFYLTDDDPDELVDLYDPEDPDVLELWELLLPEVERAQALIPEYTATSPGP